MLELPKELCFSSDDEDDELDNGDLSGFTVILKSKKPVKYVPDHEKESDGSKIGYNYEWHDSTKREKNLILEAPRPLTHVLKAASHQKT